MWVSEIIILECPLENKRSSHSPQSVASNEALQSSAYPMNEFAAEAKEVQGFF